MLHAVSSVADVQRLAARAVEIEETLPLVRFPRLTASLMHAEGSVHFKMRFVLDPAGQPAVHVRAETVVALTCQRTLEVYEQPLVIDSKLGAISKEDEEASLLAGYEPLLLDGHPRTYAQIAEDELILALPLVPVKPGSEDAIKPWAMPEQEEVVKANPFAALMKLKKPN
jgi:uncharacterized protein